MRIVSPAIGRHTRCSPMVILAATPCAVHPHAATGPMALCRVYNRIHNGAWMLEANFSMILKAFFAAAIRSDIFRSSVVLANMCPVDRVHALRCSRIHFVTVTLKIQHFFLSSSPMRNLPRRAVVRLPSTTLSSPSSWRATSRHLPTQSGEPLLIKSYPKTRASDVCVHRRHTP